MSNRRSFTPEVQDSDSLTQNILTKNLQDYLTCNSCENQSEDDGESTDDGFD